MDACLQIVVSNAAIVTLMAVAVELLGRVWKHAQALHLLWVVVLIKLVLPPVLWIPIAGVTHEPARAGSRAELEPTARPSSASHQAAAPSPEFTSAPAINNTSVPMAALGVFTLKWQLLVPVALGLWGVGALVIAIMHAIAILRFRGVLRLARPAGPELLAIAAELAQALRLRRVPAVLCVPAHLSPCVWAIGCRATVLLPEALCGELDPAGLRSIVAHELAHIRRGDHFVRVIELAVSTLFWWHPVVWWARRRLRDLEETCCDGLVLRVAACDARSYASALIDTLEFLAAGPSLAPQAATGIRPSVRLAERIKALPGQAARSNLGSRWLLVACVAGIPAALGLAAVPQAGPAQAVTAGAEVPAVLQGQTEFRGVVLDRQKRPIAGAELLLYGNASGGEPDRILAQAKCDDKGAFHIRLAPEDAAAWRIWSTAVLWARAPQHALGVLKVHPSEPPFVQPLELQLGPDTTAELELKSPDGAALAGTLERIEVFNQFVPTAWMPQFPAEISEGRLTLQGVPNDPQDQGDARSVWIRTRDLGLQEFTWWHAQDPAPVKRVSLQARPLATVEGRLYGRPRPLPDETVAGVELEISTLYAPETTLGATWCRGHAKVRTDASGGFQVRIAAGKLMSVSSHFPKETKLRALTSRGEIELRPGEQHQLAVHVYSTRTMRGTVRRASGEPAMMRFSVTHGNLARENDGDNVLTRGQFRDDFYTDASGRFEHEVIPGDVYLTRNAGLGERLTLGWFWRRPGGIEDGFLRIPSGDDPYDLPPIVIHTVSGRVIDGQQQPFTRGLLMLDGSFAVIQTDGTFRGETVLPPERYTVLTGEGNESFGKPLPATIVSRDPLVLQVVQ